MGDIIIEEDNIISAGEEAKARNNQNNAQMVQKLADAASKSPVPYAKPIGKAIQGTGGRVSKGLGKSLTTLNKVAPGGRLVQKATNKMNESGTADRISSVVNKKKNGLLSNFGITSNKNNFKPSPAADINGDSRKNETIDDSAQSGDGSMRLTMKVIKYILFIMPAALTIIVFCCLFITASQMVLNVFTIGAADKASDSVMEEKINKKGTSGLDEEKDDVDVGETEAVSYDYYISDNKFDNIIQISNKTPYLNRKYNEADLDMLEDYFPQVTDESKNYDENMVYDFFFKMFNLFKIYDEKYDVQLDLPLLMSTLNIQSSDKNVIFEANLSEIDRENTVRESFDDFDYYYNDWSFYKLSKNDSEYDMQILAQNMVSVESETGCEGKTNDGKCYKIDHEKYKEFLKEFLEKKYYLSGLYSVGNNQGDESSSMAKRMIEVANYEYSSSLGEIGGSKYIGSYGYTYKVPWSAIFVWYVSANTRQAGKSLYPDVIPFKAAGTGTNMNYFNTSELSHINFYYNDSCKNLKGKNGDLSYTPKIGDYIFIDWESEFYDISSKTQDHTGVVEKYENGIIYTIEGHVSNKVAKRTYSINDCRVIGFGSWY